MVMMATQQCEYASCHWAVQVKMVKMVNLMLCIFLHTDVERMVRVDVTEKVPLEQVIAKVRGLAMLKTLEMEA